MAANTVVFVQGEKKKEDTFPWMFFHFDPWSDTKPAAVRLAYFDYPAGQLKIWNHHVLKRGSAPRIAPDAVSDLTPKTHIRLFNGSIDTGPERPSVLALYDWIKGQPKGSIRSLQVFSHGFIGGPILWDSYEFDAAGDEMDPYDGADRDPHDTDFRIRDFAGTNPLAGAEGRKFAAAFAPDALVKLWGCVAPEGVRAPLRGYMRAPKGNRGDLLRKAHLRDYVESVEESFAMEMARRLDLAVWASPVGYGSQPHTRVPYGLRKVLNVKYRGVFPPNLRKDQWWRVSWYFRHQDQGVQFYRNVLGARVDAVDFVEYRKSWFEAAKRIATASTEPSPFDSPGELQRRVTDQVDALRLA